MPSRVIAAKAQYHNPQVDTVINIKNHPGPIALAPHGARKE
jgi:hypothetical protein